MDFPAKSNHDVIRVLYGDVQMIQVISVDDTYVTLKGVMWVLYFDDVGGSDDIIYVKRGV